MPRRTKKQLEYIEKLKKQGLNQCPACGNIFSFTSDFFCQYKGKLINRCKQCRIKDNKKYREDDSSNYKKSTEKKLKNPEYKAKAILRSKIRYEKIKYTKEYKEQCRIARKRRRENPTNRMSLISRKRIWDALQKQTTSRLQKTSVLLGCSYQFFVKYLESLFTKNMTWENYGFGGWHIDHIIPCTSFDLTKEEEQRKCFHYTNSMPRWATTEIAQAQGEDENYIGNLNKGAKIL